MEQPSDMLTMHVARLSPCGVTSAGLRPETSAEAMPMWIVSVLSLWAAYWAAMFAQIAHLRAIDDGVGAVAFSWISRAFLAVGFGLFVVAKSG